MKDGRRLSKQLTYASGQPPDLLPVEDVINKYKTCAENVLTSKKIDASVRLTLELEELDDVSRLIDSVAFQVG